MSDSATLHRLRQKWLADPQLRLAPPASQESLAAFEAKFSVRLPAIVRDVYRMADGFAPAGEVDAELFRFWPLSEVEPVSTYEGGEYSFEGAEAWFLFVDHMQWSWAYVCNLTDEQGPVALIGVVGDPVVVADTFAEFLELYIADDERLYQGSGDPQLPAEIAHIRGLIQTDASAALDSILALMRRAPWSGRLLLEELLEVEPSRFLRTIEKTTRSDIMFAEQVAFLDLANVAQPAAGRLRELRSRVRRELGMEDPNGR
jgi:hypothetical protein